MIDVTERSAVAHSRATIGPPALDRPPQERTDPRDLAPLARSRRAGEVAPLRQPPRVEPSALIAFGLTWLLIGLVAVGIIIGLRAVLGSS